MMVLKIRLYLTTQVTIEIYYYESPTTPSPTVYIYIYIRGGLSKNRNVWRGEDKNNNSPADFLTALPPLTLQEGVGLTCVIMINESKPFQPHC